LHISLNNVCCYLTVDLGKHKSQDVDGVNELFLYKKTNINLNITKKYLTFYAFNFFHIEAVKQDQFLTHLKSLSYTVF
jgi:hypothetical protein